MPSNSSVFQADRAHVFHSWSVQGALNPMVIQSGKGCKVWDYDGNEYLDFSSQLVNTNVGHQHPKMIAGIKAQADELLTIAPSIANHARNEAAKRIVDLAPDNFNKVFFTNGGADAVENAIRMARLYTGRDKVLSAYRSYHGNTGVAIATTGEPRRFSNEYARGHVHFFIPYLYRSEFFAKTEEEECERALAHLRSVIEFEGASSIGALILESVPGTAGVMIAPEGYMQGVRALCDEFGIMMIMDEVMAGFGRTGKWFAFEHYDGVVPDLITFAKGVNSGYVPVGGVVISDAIADYFDDRMFPGGLTYSGHPLATASIVTCIDTMKEEGIVENAANMGEVLKEKLAALARKHVGIGEVRGVGVFWVVELVSDRETRAKVPAKNMNRIKAGLIAKGLLPMIADNRIHIVPPCIVTEAEIDQALAILSEVLTDEQL
ncbi:MAG: aspartate aminotransferase family protein [Gammaproteobacteria bacterium]|nr:MAG: aspartate aminotransferase family protein [Gammaproteobacteria bacterium]